MIIELFLGAFPANLSKIQTSQTTDGEISCMWILSKCLQLEFHYIHEVKQSLN